MTFLIDKGIFGPKVFFGDDKCIFYGGRQAGRLNIDPLQVKS